MAEKKIIIGLVGEAGSGKDTVADYLRDKYKAASFRFQDPLREALEIFFGEGQVAREQMSWLSTGIRAKYGNHVITDALKRRIDKVARGMVVVNGMRVKEDIDFIRGFPNSFIIYVTLGQKERWKRIYSRGEKADDAVSFEKFQELERAETEVQIPEIGKKADFRLVNNKTKEDLFAKVDEIMASIK